MRTPLRLGFVAAMVVGAVATTVVVVPQLTDDAPADPLDDLRSRSTGAVQVVEDPAGGARFLGTDPGHPIVLATDDPATAADEFTDRYGSVLGAGRTDLVPASTTPSLTGGTAVRYQQEVGGIPVFGALASVQVDAGGGVLSSFADLSHRATEAPTEVTVDAGAARQAALDATARETGAPRSALAASTPVARIYDPLVLGNDPTFGVRRTWLVEVTAADPPVRQLVLVDAGTGGIALTFSQLAEASSLNRKVCDFQNVPAADETCTSPVRVEGGPAHPVADVNSAYKHSGTAYQWFFNTFGRDGPADDGAPMKSSVRYCKPSEACPYANAFWNGEQLTFGAGYPTDDVVAHELTHGVTEFTANLFFWYQSGAINESMSDVFGELIDLSHGTDDTPANRWLIGENLPGGALRDMENPPAFAHPDSTTHANYVAGPGDEGGVHSNSGVGNKAAALMTDGGTFGGQTVTALGTTKVAAIYYEALTTMLTSASDFQDLHAALTQACANLVTAGAAGLTAADCLEVRDAVDGVGMNTVPPAAPATDATVCADAEPVGDLFFDDLEDTNDGTWSYQTPAGPFRWAYGSESGVEYATSGHQGFWGADVGATSDRSVALTAPVVLPPGSHPVLHFRHAYGFDTSAGNHWDGGVVEYSTDGLSGPWHDLGPMFEVNGYSGTLVASGANPIKGRPAFVDESRGYLSSRVDLSSLTGESVRLRFRIGEDNQVGDRGWFVDDIRVADCPNPSLEVTQAADDETVVAGDDIDFHVTLHNDGNLALTGLALANSTATDCDQTVADLAPDDTVVIDCSHPTVDPDDVGDWSNIATVTAAQLPVEGIASDPLEVVVEAPTPSVAVELVASPTTVTAGDAIDLDITVTNDGNVDLTGLALEVAAAPDCSGPVADLAVDANAFVECTYTTVDPDDVGTWTGTAEVTADQVVTPVASAPAEVTVLAPGTPALTVGHRAVEASVPFGDPVSLDVSVVNTGNVPLTGVTIVAPDAPDCAGPITDPIPVGGQQVVECSHTPTAVGTWTSTVSVTTDELPDPESSPTVSVDVLDVVDPSIALTTPADGALVNQGQIVLANYACTDDQPGPVGCVGTVADGQPIDTSTPGEHTFTVTATDASGNDAVVEHTYTVAFRRPDGRIRLGVSGTVVGDDRYNATGTGQNRVARVPRGGQVTFFVTVQNDGSHPEALKVRGQRSTAHYAVRYFTGGVDITTKLNNGTYTTPVLAPGVARSIKVVVTVSSVAPAGGQVDRLVTATSSSDSKQKDVVRFIVKRR